MSEKIFEIGIPVDEDGFLEMECDFCKNRFMLHADTFRDESYLHFFCPICGLPNETDTFYCPEVLEKMEQVALNYMYSELERTLGMVDDTLVDKKGEAREHLKQWLKALPFINVYYVGVVDDKTLSCLVLTEDEMHTYELEHLTADFVIPEQYYVVTYAAAEHDSEHDTSEACILSSLQRAQDMNMKIGNYMVGRMIRYIQHAGKYVSVNKMCYPIADE